MDNFLLRFLNNIEITVLPIFLCGILITNRYLFGALFLWLRKKAAPQPTYAANPWPTVCIAMPMYNEGPDVAQSIQSFKDQDYPAYLLSYIIVDDCSTDDSAKQVARAIGDDTRGRLVKNKVNMGKRRGLVNAVRMTDADIVVSVDSDVCLNKDAISELVHQFEDPDVAAVGGRVGVSNANENWLTMMQTVKYYVGYEFLKGIENAFGSIMCLSGCLTAYRRSVLLEVEPKLITRRIGPIRIKYGEDRFLTRQIVQLGYHTFLHTKAGCFTKVPSTLSNFFGQQSRWRRSNIVDYMGGLVNAQKLHPVVAIHYFSLSAVFLIYPVWVLANLATHRFGNAIIIHLALLAILSLHYWGATRALPKKYRVNPVAFLAMTAVMPVTYWLLTPLAIFTLDSGSWETRKKTSP